VLIITIRIVAVANLHYIFGIVPTMPTGHIHAPGCFGMAFEIGISLNTALVVATR
jgi:hypothetical protein